ncbi:MAG: hypothetical protein FWE80_01300 [Oscillospiraceae bacterium]|nr:hypothetical protein [Oscillospiraceae bacterium]
MNQENIPETTSLAEVSDTPDLSASPEKPRNKSGKLIILCAGIFSGACLLTFILIFFIALSPLSKKLESANSEIDSNQIEIANLKEETVSLKEETANLKDETAKLKEELSGKKDEIEESKKEYVAAMAKIEAAKLDVEKANAEAEDAKKEADNTKKEADSAKKEADSAKKEADSAKKEAANALSDLEKKKKEVQTVTNQLNEKQALLDVADKKVAKASEVSTKIKQYGDQLGVVADLFDAFDDAVMAGSYRLADYYLYLIGETANALKNTADSLLVLMGEFDRIK